MSHKVTLRRYDEKENEALIALWLRTWDFAYPHIKFAKRVQWFRDYLKLHLIPKTVITVAELDGALVGFFTIDPASGYIDQVAVAPEQWGTGVAGKLFGKAKQLSPGRIDLQVNTYNTRAIRFYKKQGCVHVRYEVTALGTFVNWMRWQK